MDSFEVFLDNEERLVKVLVKGEVFQEEGEKIITSARQKALEHRYHILYDMRDATTSVSFTGWYDLPKKLEVLQTQDARLTRAAILISRADKALEDYKFYELVTGNVGLKLRFFFEETDALEWLRRIC